MEDCLAPGVPKVEKANGAKGPLIPRKGRLCGLWRKNELETPGDKEVSPNSLCPAWELLSSPEARGSLGRGWRGGEGTEALHLGSANTEGGDPSPSSPGCPKRQDRWRWRELGDREGGGGHCLDKRHPPRKGEEGTRRPARVYVRAPSPRLRPCGLCTRLERPLATGSEGVSPVVF